MILTNHRERAEVVESHGNHCLKSCTGKDAQQQWTAIIQEDSENFTGRVKQGEELGRKTDEERVKRKSNVKLQEEDSEYREWF